MSPERRAEVVAVLEKHQWGTDWDACLCLAVRSVPVGRADAWMAEHQLDMLVKAGFEPFRPIDVVPSGP